MGLLSGRPVKMSMDYIEEFTPGNPRHAVVIQLKTEVMRDGTLVAQESHVYFNSRAYGGFKPAPGVNLGEAAKACGPYRVPHVLLEGVQVYTNTVPEGFMRAPGEPQTVFAPRVPHGRDYPATGHGPSGYPHENVLRQGDENPLGNVFQNVRAKKL